MDTSRYQMSFMRSLCLGRIEEDIILPFPKIPEVEKVVLKSLVETLQVWLKKHEGHFRQWDRAGEFPKEFLDEIRQMGLFSLIIPEESGGLSLSATGYSRVLQELSKYDGSVAITVGAHNSIGMRGLVLFGTQEQKNKYYNRLATGEMIAAFCLTEPGAGSDAASIQTKAVRDGQDWILTGQKLWITNGGIADFFTVFAKTEDASGKMTAFLVTRDLGGITSGPHEDKMGLRASSTTTVHFDQVRVPAQNVLGEVGQGFKVAMKILNSGRTGLGGGCVGSMKHVIALASAQANQRVQFGQKIGDYGLIKQKLGHMVVDCYAAESVVALVAGLVDQGYQDYAVEAAISKVFSTECLWKTADEGLQIAGGNGFMCEFPYERIMRDARVNRIFEGTNDILRLFIALTAMHDVGQQLKDLSHSFEGIFHHPIKGFGVLSDYSWKKLSQVTGFGEKTTFQNLHPAVRPYGEIFEHCVRDLAAAVERILKKHGKNIIGKQFAIQRLADIMIELFVFACVLSRVHSAIESSGTEATVHEVSILNVFAHQVRRRIKGWFEKIDTNDDELIKSLAEDVLNAQQYRWDNL